MEFENLIAKIIIKYMDDNKVEDFGYEHAWELAKIIETVAKPKGRAEAKRDLTLKQIIEK